MYEFGNRPVSIHTKCRTKEYAIEIPPKLSKTSSVSSIYIGAAESAWVKKSRPTHRASHLIFAWDPRPQFFRPNALKPERAD